MTSLRAYLLNGLPVDLRDPIRLSEQARRVRALLLDEGLTDQVRVKAAREALHGDDHLERDTFIWLKAVLRGHYGIEHTAAELTPEEQLGFWEVLSARFPENAELRLVHADALLLVGRVEPALDLFLRSFEQVPALIFEMSNES